MVSYGHEIDRVYKAEDYLPNCYNFEKNRKEKLNQAEGILRDIQKEDLIFLVKFIVYPVIK